MTRESKALLSFTQEWKNARVREAQREGTVLGVCDDGAKCEHDRRRRYQPTGFLIVRWDG